jgi:hypothetical protein
VTCVPAAIVSVLGLKGPPPPLIDTLAKAIGEQFGPGLGLGEGLVPGDGLGLGEGLVPGDGLGLGEGLVPGDGLGLGEGLVPGDGLGLGEGLMLGDGLGLGLGEGLMPGDGLGLGEGLMPGDGLGEGLGSTRCAYTVGELSTATARRVTTRRRCLVIIYGGWEVPFPARVVLHPEAGDAQTVES